ncbi:MAG: hypothetical protein IJ709_09115 [Selenomonas sp.]|nr:hypothetical protein [Selenomonas sp.]
MRKKPIDSLERFYGQLNSEENAANVIAFNGKQLKKLLKDGYYIETISELWYDSEEGGLDFNSWIEEYTEGNWVTSQKDVDNMAEYVVRRFSHLARRRSQKVLPRAYKAKRGAYLAVYLYMRDRINSDYMIFLKKKGEN